MRKLFRRELPELPEVHGRMMVSLIRRCWEQNPEHRPSFHEILAEFQDHPDQIVLGANASVVADYIEMIICWESQNQHGGST
jgi:hypothetical protein